jgi:hypothetical protein
VNKPRGKWKRAAALKAGEREQYAVKRSYGTVVVELTWEFDPNYKRMDIEQMPWVTRILITPPGETVPDVATWHSYTLDVARQKFKELVRKHP